MLCLAYLRDGEALADELSLDICSNRSPLTLTVSISYERVDLLQVCINPSNAEATFVKCTRSQNISENHLNPVVLVFIRQLLQSALI